MLRAHQGSVQSNRESNSSRTTQQATNGHHLSDGKRLTAIADVTLTGAHHPYKVIIFEVLKIIEKFSFRK